MPTEVKICGLSSPDAVDAAVAGRADYVGFVFFAPSPRHVALADAVRLAAPARGRAAVTALTVDATDAALDEIAATLRPDFLQMHGSESPARVAETRRRTGIPVIKAIAVSSSADLSRAADYAAVADRLLLDAKAPAGATRPGGNGVAFDWSLLQGFAPGVRWLLSGGLNPANVQAALAATAAPAVDVSSGVEGGSGRKDPALIHAFFQAVRAGHSPDKIRRAG